MRKAVKTVLFFMVCALIFLIYSSYYSNLTSKFFRWGEIVIVISLFAGMGKFFKKETLKIKSFNSDSIYSVVTVLAFVGTFLAGIFNLSSDKFAFNNIVREHPGYLFETTRIVLEDDEYLKRYPAKNKLALFVASKISSHFVPTDEMLKNSGMNFRDYRELLNPSSSEKNTVILKDDREYAERARKKITKISRKTLEVMIPVVESVREWATVQTSMENPQDIVVDGLLIKGSSDILRRKLKDTQTELLNEGQPEIVDVYSILSKDEEFVRIISQTYVNKLGGGVSLQAGKKIIASFLSTGVTVSPRMKGSIRWIYRYVYDPLFSTFMAILVFFMVIAAYRHFDLRKYSTAVITISTVFTILGFLPQADSFFNSYFSSTWKGPFSSGWLMTVFALPVFKAFAIGTGTGVVYMYIKKYAGSFQKGGTDGK